MYQSGLQAGLFSAVTSAFIIAVHSEIRPDPNEETAALLRVLLYKMDNTTFGDDVPALPQWTGPPRTIVQVQSILLASLTASLLSAFLATLGKQWLNRYNSIDKRGSAIERSRNRQRKLNGIVTWYFEYVIGSLPVRLQLALLLLGCALSLYLWGINITVASVVIGVTSLGITFYLFIVIAGTASLSCPYQTPGSRILRGLRRTVPILALRSARLAFPPAVTSAIGSAVALAFRYVVELLVRAGMLLPRYRRPSARSRRPSIWSPLRITLINFFRKLTCTSVVGSDRSEPIYGGRGRLLDGPSASGHISDVLDLNFISWMLHTSLDKDNHLPALGYLATIVALPDSDPALVVGCLNAFTSCVKVIGGNMAIANGAEQLAIMSATCLLRTFSHLSVMDPTSSVLTDVHQRYARIFPYEITFDNLPFTHTFNAVHSILHQRWRDQWAQQRDCTPSSQEHAVVAHTLTELAQSNYRRGGHWGKVPRWILRFAMRSLSLNPPPPTSVVIEYLSIIALDLGCDVPSTRTSNLDERCVLI